MSKKLQTAKTLFEKYNGCSFTTSEISEAIKVYNDGDIDAFITTVSKSKPDCYDDSWGDYETGDYDTGY